MPADSLTYAAADTLAVRHKAIPAHKELPLIPDSSFVGPRLYAEPSAPAGADSVATHPLVLELSRPRMEINLAEIAVAPAPPQWQTGLEGTPRSIGVGDNSAVLALVSAVLVAMMLGYRHFRRLFGVLIGTLRGMRSRGNAFDEHTSAEARMMVMMAVQWCLCTGLLAYSAISAFVAHGALPTSRAFAHTGLLICLMGSYYVFQLIAYSAVGYTFADSGGRRLFVSGFTASQALLGFALIVPALLSIFYPAVSVEAVWAGAALYAAARIVFIVKGFKIFYTNFISLLYFILYLCTLEIIPLLGVACAAVWLVSVL